MSTSMSSLHICCQALRAYNSIQFNFTSMFQAWLGLSDGSCQSPKAYNIVICNTVYNDYAVNELAWMSGPCTLPASSKNRWNVYQLLSQSALSALLTDQTTSSLAPVDSWWQTLCGAFCMPTATHTLPFWLARQGYWQPETSCLGASKAS